MKHNIKCGNKIGEGFTSHCVTATVFLINPDGWKPVARCLSCYNAHKNDWKAVCYTRVTYKEYLIHEVLRS